MSGKKKCALCGEDIAGDFFVLEGQPIGQKHRDEVGEDEWTAVGHYRREHVANHRKNFLLNELDNVLILRVDQPERGFRLLVPQREREKACHLIAEIFNRMVICPVCLAEFHQNEVSCPMCGNRRQEG